MENVLVKVKSIPLERGDRVILIMMQLPQELFECLIQISYSKNETHNANIRYESDHIPLPEKYTAEIKTGNTVDKDTKLP